MYQTNALPSIGNNKAIQILTVLLFSTFIITAQTMPAIQSIQAASPLTLVTELAVSLFTVAYFMPPALGSLANSTFTYYDGNCSGCSNTTISYIDTNVVSLIQIVVPIITGLAIVIIFIAYVKKSYGSE